MEIKKLWEGYKFPKCENCKKECQGHLDYKNLCSNLNYLQEYAEKNYEKNRDSFVELKKIVGEMRPKIFSFGCGLGLDYIGAKEVFGNNLSYYGIDECDWAIKETKNYKDFEPKLPTTMKYDDGIVLLSLTQEDAVICFFNSLFTISNNEDLENQLLDALRNKRNFYIVCDYTVNNNFHMPKEEINFLNRLIRKLRGSFSFKRFEILDGKGIILQGSRV